MLITVGPEFSGVVKDELWLTEDPEPVFDEYKGLEAAEEFGTLPVGDVLSVPVFVEGMLLLIPPDVLLAPVFKQEHADEILEGES